MSSGALPHERDIQYGKSHSDDARRIILREIAERVGVQVDAEEYLYFRRNRVNYANVANDINVENAWWTTEPFRDAAEWIRYRLLNQGTRKQLWWNDNVVKETIKLYENRLRQRPMRPTEIYAYFLVSENGIRFLTVEELFKVLVIVSLSALAVLGEVKDILSLKITAMILGAGLFFSSELGRPLHRIVSLTQYRDLPPNSERRARAAILSTMAGLKQFDVPSRSWGEISEFSSSGTFLSRVFTSELAREGALFEQLKDGVVKMTWPKRPERSPRHFRMTNDVLRLTDSSSAERIDGLVDFHNHEYLVG